jgi:hypothetical protein
VVPRRGDLAGIDRRHDMSGSKILGLKDMIAATNHHGAVPCWMCGEVADSGEHIFKARALRRIFDRGGYAPNDLPFYFDEEGHGRIRGPKSRRMKYPNLICTPCNNDRTSNFDRTYDRLSDWFARQQNNYGITKIDFRDVFGEDSTASIDALRRYCAKALGCRLLANGYRLPVNLFPNPVRDTDISLLQLSICSAHPFRHEKKFRPVMMERVLGNGPLDVNISRSHLELTGERGALNAAWWESIGHFQITYWFNIAVNPELGAPIDDAATVYTIVHSELCLPEMKSMMSGWVSNYPPLRDLP